MRERPINLRDHEVRAILGGATQLRRIVKMPPTADFVEPVGMIAGPDGEFYESDDGGPIFVANCKDRSRVVHPPARIGDLWWGRECFTVLGAVSPATDEPLPIGPGERLIEAPTSWTDREGRTRWNYDGRVVAYRANSEIEFCDGDGFSGDMANRNDMPRWRPSVHMPRWASRLSLRVTSVRAERVQDVTEADAMAMGERANEVAYSAREAYVDTFCSEYGSGSWDRNDWVWVFGAERIGGRDG